MLDYSATLLRDAHQSLQMWEMWRSLFTARRIMSAKPLDARRAAETAERLYRVVERRAATIGTLAIPENEELREALADFEEAFARITTSAPIA